MSYCLNPDCPKPQNPNHGKFCQKCGSKLLLRERYRAIRPLGEGGFGRTFLAVDEDRLRDRCVIKQFCPTIKNVKALQKAVELFNQEAIRLYELGQHPQIPTLLASFEQDSRLYLVQEYIEGPTLGDELDELGAFNEAQIWEVLGDLLPVLQFVHDHQVIHRDIKPRNILRRQSDRQLVLIDFGVAKQVSGVQIPHNGTKIGTAGYAPVEQLRGGQAYPASDLYSLGATCLHLLTQVKPDQLYDPVAGHWLWREHLQEKGISISDRLGHILDKLLKDIVKERYQSATDVLKDLSTTASLSPLMFSVPLPGSSAHLGTWKCVYTFSDHTDAVRSIAISPNGQFLVSGSRDRTINIWQLGTGVLLKTLPGHSWSVGTVAISPNSQFIASGSYDHTIKLWSFGTGRIEVSSEPVPLATLIGHFDWVNTVIFSPDSQMLASGSDDQTIRLWQWETGKILYTLSDHEGGVNTLAFTPDGQLLVSGSSDKTLKLWRRKTDPEENITWELEQTLSRHSHRINVIAITPDGQTLVSGSDDKTIKIWNLTNGAKLLRTLTDHLDAILSLAIAPNGQMLATGSRDNTIKLWSLPTGELLTTLSGHTWWVNAIAFSPDGQMLATGSGDKTIKLWRLA